MTTRTTPARFGRRTASWALAVFVVLALGSGVGARAVAAGPRQVVLVAPPGSRLGEELKRELEISGFVVVPIGAAAGDWRTLAQAQVSPQLPYAVAVRDDERQMTVFMYASPEAGPAVSLEVPLESDTRLARRRACLTVVEFLRVQNASETSGLKEVPSAPPVPVPEIEATPAAGPPPTPVEVAPPPEPPPPAAPVPAAIVPVPPPPTVAGRDPGRDSSAAVPAPLEWREWSLGVATTLDVASTWSRPAGHLQFMWYFPVARSLAVRLRAHWPLLGVDFESGGENIRTWMFGAAVGLQLALTDPPSRWRPFVGLALGNRIQLTEVSSANPLQSRTGFTPSATVSLETGVRYALRPHFQLLVELEGSRDWLFSTVNHTDQVVADANELSFHASVGALFE